MRMPKWLRREEADREAERRARAERLKAERALRETTDRWPTVNEAADAVAHIRRAHPDAFVEDLAAAMRARHNRREA